MMVNTSIDSGSAPVSYVSEEFLVAKDRADGTCPVVYRDGVEDTVQVDRVRIEQAWEMEGLTLWWSASKMAAVLRNFGLLPYDVRTSGYSL